MMSPHMEALGLTLVHFCWQAALIAALYKLADLALPKLKASDRYLMSLTAMLAMFAAAVITLLYEEIRLFQATPAETASDAGGMLMQALGPDLSKKLHFSALLPWLDGIWLAGVVALSVRMLAGLWYIHGLKKHASPVPSAIELRFKAALRRFGLTGKVRIRLHPAISGPFVVGAFRSVVYLPLSAVTSLSPEQLDAVLSHELEHIRRADYVWNLIQSLVETLFFYHPAVWWIGTKLREQRELCCDDAAVSACDDPLTYATALLSLEEQRRGVKPRPAEQGLTPDLVMALNGQGKDLLSRIARILGESAGDPRLKARPIAFVVLPVMLLTLTAFTAPVKEVAASICPQAASGATAAITRLQDVMGGNTDQQSMVTDAQAAEADLQAAEHPVYEDNGDWTDTDIDPDAVAAEARAAATEARAEIARAKATAIDPEAIAREARQAAEQARAEMARTGRPSDIDPEAIAAQARAEAERARADIARLDAESIDPEAIAAQARAGAIEARKHRAQIRVRVPQPPRAPEPPAPMIETPAPLAPPEPPAAPSAMLTSPKAPLPPKAPKAPRAVVVTPATIDARAVILIDPPVEARPAPNAAPVITLDRLPHAVPVAIPAPDVRTDVTVKVVTHKKVAVQVAVNLDH